MFVTVPKLRTRQLCITASMFASAFVAAPAFAASVSLSPNPVTGSDYLIYKQVGSNTVVDNNLSLLPSILEGNCPVVNGACNPAGSPGGNIELGASLDKSSSYSASFGSAPVTTLSGTLNGEAIRFSNLNGVDWFGTNLDITYHSKGAANSTFASRWFHEALDASGIVETDSDRQFFFNTFLQSGGFQRISAPNLAYVYQDTPTSDVKIGLAGYLNGLELLVEIFTARFITPSTPLETVNWYKTTARNYINSKRIPTAQNTPLYASEIIKVVYGGVTQLKYSFTAAQSGLTATTNPLSQQGNFEISLSSAVPPSPPPTTPPSNSGDNGVEFPPQETPSPDPTTSPSEPSGEVSPPPTTPSSEPSGEASPPPITPPGDSGSGDTPALPPVEVPEPTTVIGVLMGVSGLWAAKRRQKQKSKQKSL